MMTPEQPNSSRTAHQPPTADEIATIYEHYARPLFAFFYRHTGQRQDAEDLTATTFSKVLTSVGRYTEQGSFEAWLWSIARHTLRDAQRRRNESVDLDLTAHHVHDPAPSPEHLAIQHEQTAMLRQVLQALPADQQQAVVLRFMHNWSFGEIAARLGRSVGAAKMLVQRGLATLRAHYPQLEHPHGSMTHAAGRTSTTTYTSDAQYQINHAATMLLGYIRQFGDLLHPLPVLQPAVVRVEPTPLYRRRRMR